MQGSDFFMKNTNVSKLLILTLTALVCFSGCVNINPSSNSQQSSSQSISSSLQSSESSSASSSSMSSSSISSEQSSSEFVSSQVSSNNVSSSENVSSQYTSSEVISSSNSSLSSSINSSQISSNITSSSQVSSISSSSPIEIYTNFVSRMDSYVADTTNPLDPDNGGLTDEEVQTIKNIITTYYASVDTTYKGETLWTSLYNATVPTQLIKYEDLKSTTKGNLYSDYAFNDKNKIVDFYTGAFITGPWVSGGKVWNREHVWCQSHGWWGEVGESKRNAGSDLHHLRPSDPGINSSRNNSLYGEVPQRDNYKKTKSLGGTTYTYGYLNGSLFTNGVFEPTDRMKGDVARIIMYLLVRYKDLATPVTNIIYTPERTANSAYQLLLKWHNEDPVSNFEIRRNHRTYEIQGNRNPFIDVPSYASAIFNNL